MFLSDEHGEERAHVLSMRRRPGHLYVAGMTTVEHQVVHDMPWDTVRPELPPLEGPVEVSVVVRCTLFRHDKSRNCHGLEGRAIFKPLNAALMRWMEDCTLRAPTLEECEAELATPTARPSPPNRKRPAAPVREQTTSQRRTQDSPRDVD